ncbi:MAG: EAL domain-containing protein, partial [Marinobacter sp.]|nr:EAL domain-containing protein [Marinobacter sp.]
LGIQVVAEGVETREQLNFLKNHRCDLIQGYLISRPIPAAELEQALSSGILNVDTPVGS